MLKSLVLAIDWLIRRLLRIYEFTDNEDCILRISVGRAGRAINLPDGTEVRPHDRIVDVHFWNERITKFRPKGSPGLGWSRKIAGRSLAMLDDYIARTPELATIKALRGDLAITDARGNAKLERYLRSIGWQHFEPAPPGRFLWRLSTDFRRLLALGLAYVYNPAGLRISPSQRERLIVWMSIDALRQRYRDAALQTRSEPAGDPATQGPAAAPGKPAPRRGRTDAPAPDSPCPNAS